MLKKGQKLCHYVGTYCSKKVVTCVERKESYCCYNSPLARILQEQGRPQLGKGWGSAQHPQCEGFTQDELERLDFDAMDLSEFEALIVQKNELDSAAAQDRGTAHTKNLVDKNLGRIRAAVCRLLTRRRSQLHGYCDTQPSIIV